MVTKKDLCILHIGMPKTGSSTIQDNFFHYGVKDRRANYNDLSISNNGICFFAIFRKDPSQFYFFKQQKFSKQDIEKFRKETKEKLKESFLDNKSSINILSGEDLFHAQYEEVVAMKEYLDIYFKKIMIIVYARPVQSFCNSAFQQLVKYHDIERYDYNMIVHRYKNIERYDKVYGKKNVKVLSFLPKNFLDGDILKDFCKYTGLEQQKSKIKKSNESLSKEAISILFTYNYHKNVKTDFGKKNAIIQNELVERIRVIGNEKFQFSGELIQNWVKNYFEDDYTWLLNRINPQDRKYFELDSLQKGVSTEIELMEYATNSIEQLASLVKPNLIDFELSKHPQTVAKLVNKLRIQIASEL